MSYAMLNLEYEESVQLSRFYRNSSHSYLYSHDILKKKMILSLRNYHIFVYV